jgi:hypothetical protein
MTWQRKRKATVIRIHSKKGQDLRISGSVAGWVLADSLLLLVFIAASPRARH